MLDFSALKNKGSIQAEERQQEETSLEARKLNKKADAIEDAKKVYQEHQKARKQSQELQWEIMKGVNNGEDIKELFLKAAKTISLITGTDLFYIQIERQIKEKY